jgi:5-hydroxyisourate hydrolase
MTGRLTTHVLDTMAGRPAAGVAVSLFRLKGGERQAVISTLTNADGRCDAPLLEADGMAVGLYELCFDVADYFTSCNVVLPDPPFLDVVPIRFGIGDASAHYHVPLLISPYGYSTYRGS